MMGTVRAMRRRYEKMLSYVIQEDDGKSGQIDERPERIGKSGPYVVRDNINITMK